MITVGELNSWGVEFRVSILCRPKSSKQQTQQVEEISNLDNESTTILNEFDDFGRIVKDERAQSMISALSRQRISFPATERF